MVKPRVAKNRMRSVSNPLSRRAGCGRGLLVAMTDPVRTPDPVDAVPIARAACRPIGPFLSAPERQVAPAGVG